MLKRAVAIFSILFWPIVAASAVYLANPTQYAEGVTGTSARTFDVAGALGLTAGSAQLYMIVCNAEAASGDIGYVRFEVHGDGDFACDDDPGSCTDWMILRPVSDLVPPYCYDTRDLGIGPITGAQLDVGCADCGGGDDVLTYQAWTATENTP